MFPRKQVVNRNVGPEKARCGRCMACPSTPGPARIVWGTPFQRHAMKPLTSVLAAALLLALAWPSAAQTSVSTSVGGNLASFSEGASASTRRQDVAATAGLEHLFNDERGRVYYDFDGGT